MPSDRTATVERQTRETSVSFTLNLDGSGRYDVSTGIQLLSVEGFLAKLRTLTT